MNELDQELREALRREEPPPGFAGRVLRRAAEEELRAARRPPLESTMRALIGWAAAAVLVAALAGGIEYHGAMKARAERAKGEAAKQQVIEALRIAGAKLQLVQEKVKGIGS